MASHKPRSVVGRLPIDYVNASARTPRNRDDFCADIDPMLAVTGGEDVQWDAMRGLTCFEQRGKLDQDAVRLLVLMLGLDALKAKPAAPPPPVSPSIVPCPQCPAGIREPCISAKTGKPWSGYHTARRRKAVQEESERRAAA